MVQKLPAGHYVDQLKFLICKIRTISFLIESQDPEHVRPIESAEIQLGLSLILNEIGDDLEKIKDSMDSSE